MRITIFCNNCNNFKENFIVYSIPGSYMGNKAGEQVPLERAQMQLFSAGPQYNMAWQEHQMTSSQGHFPLVCSFSWFDLIFCFFIFFYF